MKNEIMPYQIDRYNVIEYLKQIGKPYAPVPDHIVKSLLENTIDDKTSSMVYIGTYLTLYLFQNDFNACNLPTKEKYKKFFDLADKTATKVLNRLEELGFIIQKKEKHKKIIFVKYPEYIEHFEGGIEIKETYTETTTTTTTTTTEKKIEKVMTLSESFLNGYIEWSNKQGKIINNPAGFKKDYTNHPEKYDLSDYEKHLLEMERQKEYKARQEAEARNRQKQELIDQKRREERIKIFEYINKLKTSDPNLYKELHDEAFALAKSKEPNMEDWLLEKNVNIIELPEIIIERGLIQF